jgi:hypothetical protein
MKDGTPFVAVVNNIKPTMYQHNPTPPTSARTAPQPLLSTAHIPVCADVAAVRLIGLSGVGGLFTEEAIRVSFSRVEAED